MGVRSCAPHLSRSRGGGGHRQGRAALWLISGLNIAEADKNCSAMSLACARCLPSPELGLGDRVTEGFRGLVDRKGGIHYGMVDMS